MGRDAMRNRRFPIIVGLAVIAILAIFFVRKEHTFQPRPPPPAQEKPDQRPGRLKIEPSTSHHQPLNYTNTHEHPIDVLVKDGESNFLSLLDRQSKTIEEAVAEYRRRYGMPPPPGFDKWYYFATKNDVQLIDEYDTIYHALLPFWGLKPETIRARVREAIGFDDNMLIGLLIRDGKPAHIHAGTEWMQDATRGMMQKFIHMLPDMDLAFNVHDEPRVVVPSDELSRLVNIALTQNIPAVAKEGLQDKFSPRPKGLNTGLRVDEVKTTRFNVFSHQSTWIPARLSCSVDSPARAVEESQATDDLSSYAISELGFVYNHTAFSDVCNSPSLATSHGFFDRPNAFNVVHELIPIFSQSKMSSFQDILYPSPWYWFGKVSYDEKRDMDWRTKENSLWWVGSTTGGFSRAGGWRRQHRQQLVKTLNAKDKAKIYYNGNLNAGQPGEDDKKVWRTKEVQRQDYKDIINVHFSHVGQCDPGDCDAQREYFDIVPPADQQDAWKYKYLLDMDGNAFSGRFYAFLKSKSLVFKMAVFREWHEEWLKPWVHYIPLSLRGDDALESVRYFSGEPEGQAQAERLAEAGRSWGNKVLRNEDFEAWFFRLLLE